MKSSVGSRLGVSGRVYGRLWLPKDELDRLVMTGVDRGPVLQNTEGDAYVYWSRKNAFTTAGISALIKSGFSSLTADRISHIGVSSDDTSAIAAGTTALPGTTEIKALGSQAEAGGTGSGSATFTGATVSDIYIVGLLRDATATKLSAAIGGTGAGIYAESFSMVLSNLTSFSLDLEYQVTGTAV